MIAKPQERGRGVGVARARGETAAGGQETGAGQEERAFNGQEVHTFNGTRSRRKKLGQNPPISCKAPVDDCQAPGLYIYRTNPQEHGHAHVLGPRTESAFLNLRLGQR